MRKFTEAQAWREIAERVDRMTDDHGFLCIEIARVDEEDLVYDETRRQMKARLREELGLSFSAYYPDTVFDRDGALEEVRKARVLAALLFAEMADDEARGR